MYIIYLLHTKEERVVKNLNFMKIILMFILIICICSVIYLVSNRNDTIVENNVYYTREEKIKEIAQIYKDNFYIIGKTKSAIVSEKENINNTDVHRDYYIYAEDGKNLIKVKEYEDTYASGTPILKKEIYIDLSKKVEDSSDLYNGVTEIYIEDWTSKVIDNYEFKTPMEKIEKILNARYDFNNGDKKIALDFRNEITVNKFDDLNFRWYGWEYEIEENEKNEYLSLGMSNEEKNLYFSFEKYENNEQKEILSIQVCELKGNLDDVTVPEL